MEPLDTPASWLYLVTLCAAVLIGLLLIHLRRQQQRLHANVQSDRHKADMLLRQFYETPLIGIAIISPSGKHWLHFNDRLCDILGYPREELAEKEWAELTHPDDLEADRTNFEWLIRHESDSYSMDKRFVRKDGSLVYANNDVKCVRDADGGVDYFVAVIQDISERKQAEIALEEARLQAQRYLDIAEVMIIALDTEGNIQMVNRRGCEILGYREAELLGKSWFDRCLPAQERDEIKAQFGRLMAADSEASEHLENRVVTRSGEERLIAWRNTVVRDEHGAITAILASGMDVTVRHVAQQALATSDARLRALVQTIPDPLWLKNDNGVYLMCNPAFECLFGASESEIVGKSDYDFVDMETADFFREHDRKAIASGKSSTNEEMLTFAVDGYRGIFETTKTPMYDPRGELIGVLGIAHDVTERKRRMAQIEKLSKLYTTLSHTNQAIVHSKDQAELFEKVCRSAVDHGGFKMAWIGLIDSETHMIRPVSIHGEGTAFIENIRLSIDAESPFGGGPTGIALRQRQPFWCQDFLHDEITRPWHEQARETGYAASAVLPVWQQQEVIGSFNLYAGEVDAFDEAARALLQEMVADIGFALENFDREAQRQEIEKRLDLVIEGSSDAPWDWDILNNEIYYSPQWWRMFGYGVDELPVNPNLWRQLCHPKDIKRVEANLQLVQQPGHERDSVESRFRHKDGHYVPILIRGIVSRDEAGNPVRLTGTCMDLTEQKATENRLREQLEELDRWFKATIDREERIIELKQEVNLLLRQRQLPPRYANAGSDETAEKGDTVNG